MIWKIIQFEICYRLKRPATYIYCFIMLVFSYLLVTLPDINFGGSGENLNINSPYIINNVSIAFLLIGSVICAAICGVPVYRDYDHNTYEIIFATSVKKGQYLWGRFIGSYIITLIIFTSVLFGILLGYNMPWVEEDLLGPFMLNAYIYSFLIFLLPGTLILSTLFFSIGSYLRNQVAVFSQGAIFIIIYYAIALSTQDIDTSKWVTLFDPFGSTAFAEMTKYWTAYEKNTQLLPFSGLIFYNRIFWLAITGIAVLLLNKGFKFSVTAPFVRFQRRVRRTATYIEGLQHTIFVPAYTASRSFKAKFDQWRSLSIFHFSKIIKSVAFILLVICSIGFVLINQMGLKILYGVSLLPVTYVLIDTLTGSFQLFLLIIITIYAGEVIWKEMGKKVNQIVDSTPISNFIMLFSKFSAIVLMEVFVLLLMMLTGIILQTVNGFYQYQIHIYLVNIFLIALPSFIILTFFIFLIHVLTRNKFLAHGIVVSFYILSGFFPQIGLRHILLRYGHVPTELYSGMNGYGKFLYPAIIVELYWILFGIILFIASFLLLKRGTETRLRERLRNIKLGFRGNYVRWVLLASILLFIAMGSFIFYNTNKVNTYHTRKESRMYKAEYEKRYRKYLDYPQPTIISINLDMELYPEISKCEVEGTYMLINRENEHIDTFHLSFFPDIEINNVEFEKEAYIIEEYKNKGFYMYKFKEAFQPKDTIWMKFDISYQEKGFTNSGRNTTIIENGTFIRNEFIPYFGYNKGFELRKRRERKKEGLVEREKFEFAELTDSSKYDEVYISNNASRIQFEATIGTSADQIVLTCGELKDRWTENNRSYYYYKAEIPIWNFFTILSARYDVVIDNYKGIEFEIFYHPDHQYSLDYLMKGMKMTVDYCTENFSEFQHKNLRIVEVPRYFGGAQSFPSTIPSSESSGFIVDMDRKNDLNLPYYLAAHEVAHQWWGHQVWSANVKGMNMLSESLANYTALMVMEKEFGKEEMGKFLKHELEIYLWNRALEQKKEPPVCEVEANSYVAYNKGSLAFYALRDFIGEDSINSALLRFVSDYAYKDAPYPTSLDLIRYIRQSTPDSLQDFVTDLFEKVVLYENTTDSVYYTKLEDGKYKVQIGMSSKKMVTDTIGKQIEENAQLYIDVGVYAKDSRREDSLIYLQKHQFAEKSRIIEVIVDKKPTKAGIDPQYKLIDRNIDDNTMKVTEKQL